MGKIEKVLNNVGVTYPEGFLASGLNCGIKKNGIKDLALLYSVRPCACAGFFTKNQAKAHPINISRMKLKNKTAQAVIVNSGNANCLNGKTGYVGAENIIKKTAEVLNLNGNNVIISSTGKIGQKFPAEKILKKLPILASKLARGRLKDKEFAVSIKTTDKRFKMAGSELKIGSKSVKIGAAVKGAGMIDPNMATMLAFFTTDLNIKKGVLYGIFKECIDDTFNSITVDGASAMSTNDTSVIFANGLAENDTLSACQLNKFQETLFLVCKKLASDIIKGAEGATKTIVITVKNAMDKLNAKLAARSIAESNLVKTAVYGRCPNWGRIIQALGSSEKPDLSKDTVIKVNNFIVFKNQTIINIKNGRGLMSKDTIQIEIDLKKGKDSYTVTTCDLTKKYVDINSAY